MCVMTEESSLFCEFIYCGCGCGKTRRKYDKQNIIRQYIPGHNITYKKGEKHPRWTGGKVKETSGYVYIWNPSHPFADYKGRVREHRLVMEQHLGRYLKPSEVVHHKNGIRDDNKIENLEVYSSHPKHMQKHTKDMSNRVCAICDRNKTFVSKKGNHVWYKHNNGFMCARCYNRSRINKP